MSGDALENFTDAEKDILRMHFSNTDRQVFALTTPRQVDRGALMSRYSRTDKTMRRVFLDEFAPNPERGDDFYRKVLLEYGDDSVAELGQAQVAVEGISNVLAQKIEDHRIGLSYLEKSSRYVQLDKKISGRYKYHRESKIMQSRYADSYLKACDLAFETYSASLHPLQVFLKEKFPIEHFTFNDSETGSEAEIGHLHKEQDVAAARKVYESTIRAKALDVLRGLVPAATLTNVGISGNGRAFEYLLSSLFSSDLSESRRIAGQLEGELAAVIPAFIRRANDQYGKALQNYWKLTKSEMRKLSEEHLSSVPVPSQPPEVRLVEFEANERAEVLVASAALYEQAAGHPLEKITEYVRSLPPERRAYVLTSYLQHRRNRRHRPGRAYEMVTYTFELFTNFGMFRDLHRHRILTTERQLLSTRHGYDMPEEIEEAGLGRSYRECMESSRSAYDEMSKTMPEEAQYVVNFAFRYPFFLRLNLREACHMIELRTTPQGHSDYRRVCQDMFRHIQNVHPVLAGGIKYVNLASQELERLGSEKRAENKRRSLSTRQ